MAALLPIAAWQTRDGKLACSRSNAKALFDGKGAYRFTYRLCSDGQ